jgi:hypothetical protein
MPSTSQPRIAYAPYSATLKAPGDRRRFVAYALSRNIDFELAKPGERYDMVIVTELSDITYWAGYASGTIVYDLIDSYLAVENTTFNDRFRGVYKFLTGAHRKFEFDYRESVKAMCRRADAVICSTAEQKVEILKHCRNVHIILDVHSTVAKTRKSGFHSGDIFKVVWEGLPSNLRQLEVVGNVLRILAAKHRIELHVVTDPMMPRFFGHLGRISTSEVARKIFHHAVCHTWQESSCAAIIAGCDLAIIPVDLGDPFTRGKPENKLLLLWKIGMPVVASATPAYERAMTAAGLDHVCRTDADWTSALERMMASQDIRRTAAVNGYEYATENFAVETIFSRWDSAFASCGFRFRPGTNSVVRTTIGGL